MDLSLIFFVHPLAPTVLTYLDVEFVPTVWHRDGEVEIKPGLPEDFLQRPWSNTDMTRSAARRPTNSPWQGKSGKQAWRESIAGEMGRIVPQESRESGSGQDDSST
ncbi:hypothetical protein FOPG_19655 [Fusarium oxysporum f. sp. conglutinans race 2 54008]|uniref:Uncharacterized protein n=1 Tax=Fusarium oxysporum f. sp. conglutinans race 2 54008 TaxID=1089457 RepID=X0GVX4_FUSOX|nr:hypothetical protein FOPG_19655 [Fusarium oxysporum f. sp. conglutinans race 2 54008]